MSTELHSKLQEALGGVYVLERELGGGGMSRVFVARDDALSRRIVVKLLPPEMGAINNAASAGVSMTSVGMVIGTPAYMSPEQCGSGNEIDGRSDIYSLACVLYEMLTGRPPFTGMSATTILMMHRTAPAPSVRALRDEVPQEIDRALTRALAKEPGDRFSSAAEFAEVLESAVSAQLTPASSRVVTPAERAGAGPQSYFVVVLPFANMSADRDNEYFSDGITEDIIAQLSLIRGLRVMSRTSAMRYKDHPESVRARRTSSSGRWDWRSPTRISARRARALDYLERAYEERVGWMLMLGQEPALDVLRETPRFKALLQKIGPVSSQRSGPSPRVSGRTRV